MRDTCVLSDSPEDADTDAPVVTFGVTDAPDSSSVCGWKEKASTAVGGTVRWLGDGSVPPGFPTLVRKADVVGPAPDSPFCCVFKGPEVAAETRSELSLSVLLGPLQELGSFSPGARLTSCGFKVVSAFQVVQDGKSGREEVRLGMVEPDTDG